MEAAAGSPGLQVADECGMPPRDSAPSRRSALLYLPMLRIASENRLHQSHRLQSLRDATSLLIQVFE